MGSPQCQVAHRRGVGGELRQGRPCSAQLIHVLQTHEGGDIDWGGARKLQGQVQDHGEDAILQHVLKICQWRWHLNVLNYSFGSWANGDSQPTKRSIFTQAFSFWSIQEGETCSNISGCSCLTNKPTNQQTNQPTNQPTKKAGNVRSFFRLYTWG